MRGTSNPKSLLSPLPPRSPDKSNSENPVSKLLLYAAMNTAHPIVGAQVCTRSYARKVNAPIDVDVRPPVGSLSADIKPGPIHIGRR